jgi:hypothetical protein
MRLVRGTALLLALSLLLAGCGGSRPTRTATGAGLVLWRVPALVRSWGRSASPRVPWSVPASVRGGLRRQLSGRPLFHTCASTRWDLERAAA